MIKPRRLILIFKARRFKDQPGYALQTHRWHSMLPEGESGGGGGSTGEASTQPHDPVKAPDGSLDFGTITPEIAQAASKPLTAAPIRLFAGHHKGQHKGFGVAHIQAEHEEEIAATGLSITEFVHDALSHYHQIWLQPNGRWALVRTGKRGRVTIIELQRQGRLYSVTTAYVRTPEIRIKGTLIWSGRTVSNTRNGMDAHEPMAQPPDPDFQRVGSPQPLAGRFPEGTPKPVLEGLENPINDMSNVPRSGKKRKPFKKALVLFFRTLPCRV